MHHDIEQTDPPSTYSAKQILKTGFDQMVSRMEYLHDRMLHLERENHALNEMLNNQADPTTDGGEL
jgi:predicted nuclease with TOPRIM domain